MQAVQTGFKGTADYQYSVLPKYIERDQCSNNLKYLVMFVYNI